MAEKSDQSRRKDRKIGRMPAEVDQLFRLHADAVEAVARGLTRDAHLAADICQSVFAKAVRRFDEIPQGAERAWLLRVAKNQAIDVLRKQGRERKHTRAAAMPPPIGMDDGEQAAVRLERILSIRAVLGELSEFDRQIVQRRFEQGQTFAEIAQETGKPLGTILSRAHRLMKNLESRLRDINDD